MRNNQHLQDKKDRRQKGTHKNSASGLMIAVVCCVVRHHNAVAISTWKWKLNKKKAVVGMTTVPSQNLKSYQVQLWVLGQRSSLSFSLSVSLSSSLSHTRWAHCLSSDIHTVSIPDRCTSHKGEGKMFLSKNKHTCRPAMHLTRLQYHLVSDTKNDPLPGTNLSVKVVFLLYSSISPPPGWSRLWCLRPQKKKGWN